VRKSFILLMAGRLLQIIATLVSLRLATTLLPQVELGKMYYIFSIQTLFAMFLINPVGQYFNRQINSWNDSGVLFQSLLRQVTYIFLVSAISLLVMVALSASGFVSVSLELSILISLLVFSQSLNQTVIYTLNMLGFRPSFVILSLLTAFSVVAFSYIGVTFCSLTVFGWISGIIAGNFIFAIVAVFYLRGKCNPVRAGAAPSEGVNKILKFCLPIALATVFIWGLNPGYRLLVEKYYGLEYLAMLAVGLAIANQIFSTAESLITQLLIPPLYKSIESKNSAGRLLVINKYFSQVIPLYVSIALFCTFTVEYLLPFLVADEYHDVYRYSIYGCWIELFRVLGNVFSVISQVQKRTTLLILPYCIGSVLFGVSFYVSEVYGWKWDVLHLLFGANFLTCAILAFIMRAEMKFTISMRSLFIIVLSTLPSVIFFNVVGAQREVSPQTVIYLMVGGGGYVIGLYIWYLKIWREAENSL